MSLPFARTALATALLGCSLATFAQDALILGDTVVSASGFEQKVTEAPASVTVVTQEDLQKKPFSGLADALRDIEGIDVGASQDKTGNISITMRGLEAKYTLVLIDGRRQSDIGNIGPNNFGNSQFMYMPSLDAIERIEVVRGPMSTLYGADAMGGVINIITKKVKKEWGGSISHGHTFQEDSQFGDSRKTDFYASGPLVDGLLGLGVRGGYFHRDESAPGYVVGGLRNPDGTPFIDEGGFGDRKSTEADNWNAGLTLNWTPHENHDFQLEYDVSKQKYDNSEGQSGTLDSVESLWRSSNGQGPNQIVQPRVGYADYQRFEREQFVLAHTGRWSFGTTDTSLTRSSSENLGRSLPLTVQERQRLQSIWNTALTDQGRTGTQKPVLDEAIRDRLTAEFLPRKGRTLEIDNTIFDTKLTTNIGNHYLTLGGQYFLAEMEDGVFGMDGGGFQSGKNQDHEQWSLFAEDSWDLLDDVTLTFGARYDDHNIFGGQVSPRAYATWRTTENWTIKGGVSTGYKTPEPNQLFEGIVGFGGQGVSPLVGNPDLEPETSVNYEVAAYYDNLDNFTANATLFFNKFKDKIETDEAASNCYNASGVQYLSSNCVNIGPGWAELGYTQFSQNANIDRAETYGTELAANWRINDQIALKGNYTFTDSEIKSGLNKGEQLTSVPRHMANATLSWQLHRDLDLSLTSEYRDERFRGTGTANTPTPKYYDSYTLFHIGANYQATQSLTLNARVNNLLDKDLSTRSCLPATASATATVISTWSCSSDYSVAEAGRSYWLSANYRF